MKKTRVDKLVVGQLKSNCFLVHNDTTRECLIIDPGDDADYIATKVQEMELLPVAIWATHGHFDHVLAASELKLVYGIPFLINPKDKFLLKRSAETSDYFTKVKSLKVESDAPLRQGAKKVLGTCVKIISTPGHTPGSLSFFFPEAKIVFVGDVIFSDGIGRYDLSYSDKPSLDSSILTLKLLKGVTAYPGHGERFVF